MKTLKIIKWGSLFLSVVCFAAISFVPKNIRQENINEEPKVPEVEQNTIIEHNFIPQTEINISPTDCKGIINAYEKQRDKFPKGLTENYNNCIEFGQPNPPSEKTNSSNSSTKEKKEKKDK